MLQIRCTKDALLIISASPSFYTCIFSFGGDMCWDTQSELRNCSLCSLMGSVCAGCNLCYDHALSSFIASGLLSYSLTESLIFSYSYTSFFTPFRWSKPLWFSSETPSKRHSGVLTSRALSNHRQLPMLAGCQNFKAALARFFSLFHHDWSPGKPRW